MMGGKGAIKAVCSGSKTAFPRVLPSTPPITRVLMGTGLKGSANSATGCTFGLVGVPPPPSGGWPLPPLPYPIRARRAACPLSTHPAGRRFAGATSLRGHIGGRGVVFALDNPSRGCARSQVGICGRM